MGAKVNEIEMDIDYKQLVKALLEAKTEKAAGSTPTELMGHGAGGLFSNAGLEQDLFSAFVLPNYGLYSKLPQYPTLTENPLFGIVTGVTGSTGDEPAGPCDDVPYAGLMKLCMQSYPLGRFSRQTRTAELDAFGKLNNRGDHKDLRIYGNGGNGLALPGAPMFATGNPAANDIDKILFEFVVAWTRDFAPMIWTGTPTNNTWKGGYKEFYGLDTLINTGYKDAVSNTACPAADSLVSSFGDVQVQNNTAGIVNHITQMVYELWHNRAFQFGLAPVVGYIVMRPQLFHILTSYWSCSYLTYRCTPSDQAYPDTGDAIAMRDAMRAGSYLLVDGVQVPVIQDDTIAETNVGAGVYESKIYFVPMTVLGGRPVTYMEYLDYNTPGGLADAAAVFAANGQYRVTDNGRFAVHVKPPTNWCVEIIAKTEPRLLLRTPQIAGVITDVRYVPYVHERDWDPDGTYFANGGGISQAKSTYYAPRA